jgi:carboxylate-amine ligase
VLAELPRAGAPPAFESYAAWGRWIERLTALGVIEDHTRVWWDVRPNPRFGTLELRVADQPTALQRTELLVDLLVRLVASAPHRDVEAAARGDYAQNRWAALRFGPRAELIHPDGDRLVRADELCYELLALIEPAVRELGTVDLLRTLDPRACEGDRQLEIGREHGLEAVAADVVERSVRSA